MVAGGEGVRGCRGGARLLGHVVARGVCMVAGGHAWLPGGMHGCGGQGACMVAGGVCGCQGLCVVAGGHAWLLGGMHGSQGACMVARGCAWLPGGCTWLLGGRAWLRGGACVGFDEIRSMSGRYASYWNGFLFNLINLG